LFDSEKQRNSKARSYIIKCCGRKTCDGESNKVRGKNSSFVDSSRNGKRLPGESGKIPGAGVAGGKPLGGGQNTNKLDTKNKK
jgi:hypothetical protein